MKKLLFFVSALLLSLSAIAQDVTTLTFTAKQQNQTYQKLDSVVVTNLSKNWTEVLLYPDTILMMNTVGIADWENSKGNVRLYQNIPNPFYGITNFNLALNKKEKVDLVIYDLNGKKVAEYHNTLGSGEHTFRATMSTPQTYLLSSVTKNGTTSIKMINLSNTGEQARIEYVGSEPLAQDIIKKQTSHPFSRGDNMRYVGFATQNDGSHNVTIEQVQDGSEEITFAFPDEKIPAYLNVFTDEVTNLTATAATLNAHWQVYDMTVKEEGFYYKTKSDTTWQIVTCEHQDPEFSISIKELSPKTDYIVKAYAMAEESAVYGEEVPFTTIDIVKPTVQMDSIGKIDYASATAFGSYVKGDEDITKIGFEMLQDSVWKEVASYTGTEAITPFNAELSALKQETKYSVRAFVITTSDTVYSEAKEFVTTKTPEPIVKTIEADGIFYNKATLHGSFVKTAEDILTTGFAYKESAATDWKEINSNNAEQFSIQITDLIPTTEYMYKAFVQTETYKTFGEILTFTTIAKGADMEVIAGDASGITRTNATVSAEVKNGADATERGFIYSLYPGRILESDATYELIGRVKDNEAGEGKFSFEFTDLIQGATYFVRAYALNADTVVYSDDIKVVMQDPEGLVDCGKMVDADGNEYRTVVLGNTCWIRENLHTTKYADGTPIDEYIPKVTDTKLLTDKAQYSRFIYKNDTLPMEVSGLYYGLGFINDEKAICPKGWHVSTMDDWCSMLNYVSETYANNTAVTCNTTAKGAIGTTELSNPLVIPYYFKTFAFGKKADNSNASGFGWFYAGSMNGNQTSSYQRCEGRYDAYWTSTPNGTFCLPWFIQNDGSKLQRYYETACQLYGYFVRCVKDAEVPDKECGEFTVTDADNNVYNTVKIGEQCWLKENLRTTKYADGTEIAQGLSSASEETGYWYYPNNVEANKDQYGLLYNWPALMYGKNEPSDANPSGVRSICPEGWHLPSLAEWIQLKAAVNIPEYQCDGDNSTAKALASRIGWTTSSNKCSPAYEAETTNDATGFSIMPAGLFNGQYYLQFSQGSHFWTSSIWSLVNQPVECILYYGINFFNVSMDNTNARSCANSVRCVQDK